VSGGIHLGRSSNVGVTEAYDPATDSWSRDLPAWRMRAAPERAVSGRTPLHYGGEYQDRNDATFRSLEAYDPGTTLADARADAVSRHGLRGGGRQPAAHGERHVQSAGTGVSVDTEEHDAYDFEGAKK